MRRFRIKRRRLAALALLGAAATTAGPAQPGAAQDTPGEGAARIDASTRTVPSGRSVVLHGGFPGASKAAIEIRSRAVGADAWRTVARDRTGAAGRYRTRVRPSRTAVWRVELAAAPKTDGEGATTAPTGGIDERTGERRITVRSRTVAKVGHRNAQVGDAVTVRGKVLPAGEQRRVRIRIGGHSERTRAGRDGRFAVRWNASRTGQFPVRVRAGANGDATASGDRPGRVTVYRPAAASWYGPGLYGNALACGGTLSPSTIGVANRTLPCGTKLKLRYKGRSVAVRVIDRGPFSGSREFDLTAATKQRLGFPDVGTVLSSR